jgi:hypothetical protein
MLKYVLKPAIADKLRERAEKLRMEILADDNAAINRVDRRLLDYKNMLTVTPPKRRGRKRKGA